MKVVVRRRQKKDCADISHVVTIAWQETYRGIVNDEFLNNLPNTEKDRTQRALKNFHRKDNHQFVILVNDRVVGFVNAGLTEDKEYPGCGEVFALYLISKYKGKGFGRKLTEVGIEELKKLGCSKMVIGCLEGNKTNAYYKHIGGKFVKTRIFKLPNQEITENVYFFENI